MVNYNFFFFHFSPLWTPPSKLQLYNLFTLAINNSIVVAESKEDKNDMVMLDSYF